MDALSIFATIFGFIALAGGAAGYFKASRGDSIIKYQATEIGLRDGTIANLKTDVATITESCSAKDQTIKKLEEHNKFLQKMRQGSPELKKLTSVIESLVKSTDAQTRVIGDMLKTKGNR